MRHPDRYFVPRQEAEDSFKEKASRFIGILVPVPTMEEAQEALRIIRKKHYDANHHCSAVRLLMDDGTVISKQDDDGEPSQTAGLPMLKVLEKEQVVQALVVAVRYFGGTKLGTGGLVRAYRETAQRVVTSENLVPRRYRFLLSGQCPYGQYKLLQRFLGEGDGLKVNEEFAEMVEFTYSFPVAEESRVLHFFQDQERQGLSFTVGERQV